MKYYEVNFVADIIRFIQEGFEDWNSIADITEADL